MRIEHHGTGEESRTYDAKLGVGNAMLRLRKISGVVRRQGKKT